MPRIADMTLEELQRLIDMRIDQRLRELLGEFEIGEETLLTDEEPDTRSLEEIFASIDANIWTPPAGSRSSLELLREDRER